MPGRILGVPTLATTRAQYLAELCLWTGLHYYMYNEMAFLVQSKVTATTHQVANTLKHVVIQITALAFLGEKMDDNTTLGAVFAIAATIVYSLAKSRPVSSLARPPSSWLLTSLNRCPSDS